MADDATTIEPANESLGFDPAALRAKYLAERDKRLRQDGNEQYVEMKGEFARYLEDPYVAAGFSRAPANRPPKPPPITTTSTSSVSGARAKPGAT